MVTMYAFLLMVKLDLGKHILCLAQSTKEFGINQLALNDLFLLSDERKDIMSYKIHVQMVEIYNEQIRDLLADDPLLTKYPFIVIFP
ncbi:hypothetical protein CQW23_33000 [Capsicum baccatum]|uniref:Kinesin motor domain-containing protein n=1 Tax=Capsicum baccatum TaxID=33114 RepID=A0A2G2V332_CAPBA|nr:hypothetical protein CQW23_33000 [Capsicum baccatum]